ncbi:hypothetical protein OIU34_21910 [Pararhizobium sp. BT-229]|uniref:hypothetical protein n=1 Tax=Pararhizobium sp. BT-229 TaxID=2986923 RepID=UPI0021F77346|nr:hypothetical protein [Pararhizobium sp. BT-229]MCV9964549.1 hypothetical protein [Pararhizobium sp. BT-229]
MRIEIPFISDLVGKHGGEHEHVYARATTSVEIPEIESRDAPEAVVWRVDGTPCNHRNGERSTIWYDSHHWMILSRGVCGLRPGLPLLRFLAALPGVSELADRGFVSLLHAGEPRKIAQFKNASNLDAVRKRLSDIQLDNTDEFATTARRLATKCLATVDGHLIIRCPEPHIVIGRNLRGGVPTAPRLTLGVSFGFNRKSANDIEHLVSLSEPDVAQAITDRILSDCFHHQGDASTDVPEVHIAIPDSIRHPWHTDSAAQAIDMMVEAGRDRLSQMATEDVHRWIALARMRDRGIDSEETALAAMRIADELQLQLRVPPFLVREFRDRLHMSVYGVRPNLQAASGGLRP